MFQQGLYYLEDTRAKCLSVDFCIGFPFELNNISEEFDLNHFDDNNSLFNILYMDLEDLVDLTEKPVSSLVSNN